MFTEAKENIVVLIICVILLVTLLSGFILTIVYQYQKRQVKYYRELQQMKTTHETDLLQSQLEIQEQTFQHMAREIHDNIGQKLTLAKLYLNTIAYTDLVLTKTSVDNSLALISASIEGLSDISRSMSTDFIMQNGLVKGIEGQVASLLQTGIYEVHFNISGKETFLAGNVELVLFRIVQESVNNVIRHSGGSRIEIGLHYTADQLTLTVADNGRGFDVNLAAAGSGLINIRKRVGMLQGSCTIHSNSGGTRITIKIPINENTAQAETDTGR